MMGLKYSELERESWKGRHMMMKDGLRVPMMKTLINPPYKMGMSLKLTMPQQFYNKEKSKFKKWKMKKK